MVSFPTQRAGIAIINRKALEKKSNGTYVPPEGSGPTTHYCLSGQRAAAADFASAGAAKPRSISNRWIRGYIASIGRRPLE
jgi:hypothetical protein